MKHHTISSGIISVNLQEIPVRDICYLFGTDLSGNLSRFPYARGLPLDRDLDSYIPR